MYKFNRIDEAIEDIKAGKMLIVVDNPDRENEGDLIMAGELVRGEDINFMASYARGLICSPCSGELLERLEIGPMVEKNTDNYQTAFTVSVDHIETTTGISAFERALSIKKLLDPETTGEDYRRPGHIFPLKAKDKGVLERPGHTEAAVDLMRLAGLKELGVICEIMNEDGTMARLPELFEFSRKHGIKIITIEDLIDYRKLKENHMDLVTRAKMPTKYGEFEIVGFVDRLSNDHHLALVMGDIGGTSPVLTRVHSECLTGDGLGSSRCDCGEQYKKAMEDIAKEGRGVLVYLRQEGRGIGLINKLKAYELQDRGYDTVDANIALGFPADLRDYSIASKILERLGISKVKLMTNNPDKIEGLEKFGIEVTERLPIIIPSNKANEFYLNTKKERMSHIL